MYVGGVEHAVLHLLYSRFWHKVLYDLGHVSSREPYRRLINQGYIQAFAYTDSRGSYVPADEVIERGDRFFYPGPDGEIEVFQEFGKIGKSLKNSISPDEICDEYGADTLRVYEMSMGPLEASRPWATKDVVGAHRFLQRVWRLVVDEHTGETRVVDGAGQPELDTDTLRSLHRTIAGVSEDYAALRNNTAAAKLIEYTNHLTKEHRDSVPRAAVEPLVLMLAPLAPHLAEELWLRLGHTTSLAHGPFPEADPGYLVDDTVEYPVQVNGKVRGRVVVAADADEDTLKAAALADEKVQAIPGRCHPAQGDRGRRPAGQLGRLRLVRTPDDRRAGPEYHLVDMTVRRRSHRIGDHRRDGFGPQEVGGVVLATLERDEFALHVGVGAARIDRGHPQLRLVGAQRVGERAQRELAGRIRGHARRNVAPRAGVDEHHLTAGASQRRQQGQRKCHRRQRH